MSRRRARARHDAVPHAGLTAGITVTLTLAAALTVWVILTVISAGLSAQTVTESAPHQSRALPGEP